MEVKEAIAKYGASAITDAELLNLIINDENKTKLLLESLSSDYGIGASAVQNLLYENLEKLKYRGKLTECQALRLCACAELGRRMGKMQIEKPKINALYDMLKLVMPIYRYKQQEHFLVACLNAKNHIIKLKELFKGGLSNTVVDIRKIFNLAIIENAAAIILSHNHPSGDPTPSQEDKEITKSLVKAGKLLDIIVLDHIIVSEGTYYSFMEMGELNP